MSASASGWGVRATSRIIRTQFDQDELLKSLGTQFNVDFSNYDQWERKNKTVQQSRSKDEMFTVGRVKSAESCQFLTHRERKQAAKLKELQKQKTERIKILELRIHTRRKTLAAYQRRHKELLEANRQLTDSIDKDETNSHDTVKGFLRRYEKYRAGMTNITKNFSKELEDAVEDLKKTKIRLTDSIAGLEKNVKEVEEQLLKQQNQIQVLNSYKDKEYPVKAMTISNLQKDMESLKISNQEDKEELEHIIATEIGKYQKDRIQVANEITHNVTEKAVLMMHPSLKDMALQNIVMEKEIEFHTKEHVELKESNDRLEEKIGKMLRDPKTNTRLQMFPEFYPPTQKCTPDMEVVLDIPTQQWLPI